MVPLNLPWVLPYVELAHCVFWRKKDGKTAHDSSCFPKALTVPEGRAFLVKQ